MKNICNKRKHEKKLKNRFQTYHFKYLIFHLLIFAEKYIKQNKIKTVTLVTGGEGMNIKICRFLLFTLKCLIRGTR